MTEIITFTLYAYLAAGWTDITADTIIDNGMDGGNGFSGTKESDRVAQSGNLTFYLKNYGTWDGKYIPGHSSCVSGWKKGTKIKIVFSYESRTKAKLYYLDSFSVEGNSAERIRCTALSWLNYAALYPIINPSIQQNITTDAAIRAIIANMAIQPQQLQLDSGFETLDYVFDNVVSGTRAATEFSKIAASEPGWVYELPNPDNGETIVFGNSSHRDNVYQADPVCVSANDAGFLLLEDGSFLLLEDGTSYLILDETENAIPDDYDILQYTTPYGANIVNRFVISAYPRKVDTVSSKIYELENPIYLPSGKSKTFLGYYSNSSGNRVNAIPPSGDTYTKTILDFFDADNPWADKTGQTIWNETDVSILTDPSKFNGRAAYFDGSGCYLTGTASTNFEFGSGDFTIDWWEYRFNATSGAASMSRDGTDAVPAWIFGRSDGTNALVDISSNGTTKDIANGKTLGAISLNTWVHLAVVRNGNNFYCFKNGTQTDTWTSSATIFNSTGLDMHIGLNNGSYITAMIGAFRISKGVARWTSSFTPQDTPYDLDGTFYTMNTAADQSGTELSCTLTASYGTEGATYTISNTSNYAGYAFIRTYGYPIHTESPIQLSNEDAASIATYEHQSIDLNQSYQQDIDTARKYGEFTVMLEKDPRFDIQKISLNANKNSMSANMFMCLDVGNVIEPKFPKLQLDNLAYISRFDYHILGGGVINYDLALKKAWASGFGLSSLVTQFTHSSPNDAINFGVVPAINLNWFIWSAWIKRASNGVVDHVIMSTLQSITRGTYMYISSDYLTLHATSFSSGTYRWRATNPITDKSNYHHIFFAVNTADLANPLIYIDGAAETVVTSLSSGSVWLGDGNCDLMIGDTNAVSYTSSPFDGRIKDVRIYDGSKIGRQASDLPALLYADGAYGASYKQGLVFQSFFVPTTSYASYQDLTLTSSTKLLDGTGLATGTPEGAPIARYT